MCKAEWSSRKSVLQDMKSDSAKRMAVLEGLKTLNPEP